MLSCLQTPLSFSTHRDETTVGWFLIAWFNNCVLGKSGQIMNPTGCIIVHVHVYTNVYVCEAINCECRKNLQFAITAYVGPCTLANFCTSVGTTGTRDDLYHTHASIWG